MRVSPRPNQRTPNRKRERKDKEAFRAKLTWRKRAWLARRGT